MSTEYQENFPVLPLRDVVVFPRLVITLFVGRDVSLRALKAAEEKGGQIFLVTQKKCEDEEPGGNDLHRVGCLAGILQTLRLPDDTVKVLVEGVERAEAVLYTGPEADGPLIAQVRRRPTAPIENQEVAAARKRALLDEFAAYVKANRQAGDLAGHLQGLGDLARIADAVAGHFPMKVEERQKFLAEFDLTRRVDQLLELMAREKDIHRLERKIKGRVKEQIEKSHREYYLNEQAKAIQRELGGNDAHADLEELKKRAKEAGMSPQARKKCDAELRKLAMMSPMSAEAGVSRTYVETLLDLPWKKRADTNGDIAAAQKTLDADHFGLEKVKERILEHLAIRKRVEHGKSPILCLVGPPGVGKTSLGQSIARATGRPFVRLALGGMRDEAEIRGHRRTYVGSMPGKIINGMIRAGVKNPLVLLDEIDKLGHDFRGDPASALLEVLDPEQNKTFSDHYIEVDYDLSETLFVTTANTLNIQPALSDRLEIIRLPGYTEEEKTAIARHFLIPRQFKENGVAENELRIGASAVRDIIRHYTREAGVRNLERHISKICRKSVLAAENAAVAAAKGKADDGKEKRAAGAVVSARNLKKYLGVRRFLYGVAANEAKIGQATGLAWTEVGGELLSVEAVKLPGRGKVQRTGKMGEVMRESVETAFSVVRARAAALGLNDKFAREHDFHIHMPEGAIPKDGPSAGIAVCATLLSVASDMAVRADTAMTGEITLRGEVLPVGGIKEKLLAAARGGVKRVILPSENIKDLEEIPQKIKESIEILPVKWIDEVFALALMGKPAARRRAPAKKARPPVVPASKSEEAVTH